MSAAVTADSVGTSLLNEVERVSAKRERWRRYKAEGMPNLDVAILLMTVAIDNGKAAIPNGDAVDGINALTSLRGFSDDD